MYDTWVIYCSNSDRDQLHNIATIYYNHALGPSRVKIEDTMYTAYWILSVNKYVHQTLNPQALTS